MSSHAETLAKRRAGNIDGWEPWYWEALGGGLLIKGGVPRLITRGPRKGQKTWDTKRSQTVVISTDDISREYIRYEAETGLCGTCLGKSKVLKCASKAGVEFVPCKACGGSGKSLQTGSIEGGI